MRIYKRPAAITYQDVPWTFRLIFFHIAIHALGSVFLGDSVFVLGHLNVDAVVAYGQWWRVFTAVFLHANILHLLFNMAGLLIFGSMLERMLDKNVLLYAYFICGIGANVVVVGVMYAQGLRYMSVGSSGAVLGIIGTCAMVFWLLWKTNKNLVWKSLWQPLVVILGLQMCIDILSPANSMLTHIAGFCVGLLFGCGVFYRRRLWTLFR